MARTAGPEPVASTDPVKLVDFSTARRVTVAMIMVAIATFGMVGFSRLAVNLLPDIAYPTIITDDCVLALSDCVANRSVALSTVDGACGGMDREELLEFLHVDIVDAVTAFATTMREIRR